MSRYKQVVPYKRRFFLLSIVLAFVAYFWGASEVQIPKIGDEVLYLQIARVTGESGSLLPLRYEEGILSTKPPLLYWLGIFSTKVFGNSLLAYRLPVLLVTFLGAALVFLLGQLYLQDRMKSLWAATAYLGFISTFQHGRPFLVNSFEVLFLLLPLFVLYRKPKLDLSHWFVCALSWGAVSWSKSFALIAVGFFSLTWASYYLVKAKLFKRLFYFGSAAAVALGIFALWFAFDPDPKLLFQQFIIGENAVKFKGYAHYFSGLFVGSYTLFRIWLGPFANAGLYVFLLIALVHLCYKNCTKLSEKDKALGVFVLAFLIFYSLPTQRQENYLLPVMAVFALLLARFREALPELSWKISLGVTDFLFIALSLAPWILSIWFEFSPVAKVLWLLAVVMYPVIYIIWDTKLSYPLLVLLCFIQITNFSDPFNRKFNSFRENSSHVWVPSRKLAQHERFKFIAPGSIPKGYLPEHFAELCPNLKAGDYVVVEAQAMEQCNRPFIVLESIRDFKTRQKPLELMKIAIGKSEYLLRDLNLIKVQE